MHLSMLLCAWCIVSKPIHSVNLCTVLHICVMHRVDPRLVFDLPPPFHLVHMSCVQILLTRDQARVRLTPPDVFLRPLFDSAVLLGAFRAPFSRNAA